MVVTLKLLVNAEMDKALIHMRLIIQSNPFCIIALIQSAFALFICDHSSRAEDVFKSPRSQIFLL